jgi:PTS system nitrogen regulatory IIA component
LSAVVCFGAVLGPAKTVVDPVGFPGTEEVSPLATRFLKQVLNPSLVRLSLEAERADDVIPELIGILSGAGLLKDPVEAERVVRVREASMSTALEHGIAIPHGKTDTVDSLLVAVGLKPTGLDFRSLDGEPTTIFLLTLSPASRTGPHIRFMAEVTRLLQSESARQGILSATTPEQVVALLTGTD